MSTQVVIGMGFGDEGKGAVTEYLCSRNPGCTKVVRFSGGHQCGHKVVKGDLEHVFSNFGSGTLSGCPTYWTKHCTFEPVGFWKEYCLLKEKGISPKISVHPECPVTTIYDVYANRRSVEVEHGTTGTGFFRTKKRHLYDGVEFTVGDLFSGPPGLIEEGLRAVRNYFGVADDLNTEPFLEACANIRQLVGSEVLLSRHPLDFVHMVFEGSQGLLLDENIGEMPHCTPSDVTPQKVLDMFVWVDEVYLVSRVYQTRHGNGPLTNTHMPLQLSNTEKETNKVNTYQGEFRSSVLDIDLLRHAKKEGIDKIMPATTKVNLVMTCADQVGAYKFTMGDSTHLFMDSDEFVRSVGGILGISGDLYVNTSPRSTTIRRIAK